MSISDFIGKQLKRIRKEKSITQHNLAKKIDLSPKHISAIENGKRNVTFRTLEKILEELEVNIQEIFDIPDLTSANPEKQKIIFKIVNLIKEKDTLFLKTLEEILSLVLKNYR